MKSQSIFAGSLLLVCLLAAGLFVFNGCSQISTNPSCPDTLRVGETGFVLSNAVNPGSFPTYSWTVEPKSAGTFNNAASADTTFQALEEGEARLVLYASDGLYFFVDECVVEIAGKVDLAVTFRANDPEPIAGDTVTLTCESVGTDSISEFDIDQTGGNLVEVTEIDPGVVRFVADQAEILEFTCKGTSKDGLISNTVRISVSVSERPDDNTNDNGNSNANGNGNNNTNNNANDNSNSNSA